MTIFPKAQIDPTTKMSSSYKTIVPLKPVALSTSIVLIVLGVLVILGWLAKIPALVQIHHSFVPMQFNTALGFLLVGAALLNVVLENRKLATGLAIVAGLVGMITLIQYIFNVDLGLDEFFMKHDITTKTSHPGRMAPNTALSFLTCAIAVGITGKTEVAIRMKVLVSAMVFALGFIAFTGYLLGVESTYGWGNLTRMALHTSLGFLVAGIGFSAVYWNSALELIDQVRRNRNAWTDGYAVVLTLMVFSADLSMPLGIATGIMYVIVVLIAFNLTRRGQSYWYATVVTAFIALGYQLSPEGAESWIVMVNRGMSVIVVWIVATLINRVKQSEADILEANASLEARVAERTETLQEMNAEMSRIVYVTSHDLQEPLRTTKGVVDIFIEDFQDKLDETSERYLHMITSSVDRMSALVSSLLDYSRIGQKKVITEVDLNEVVAGVQESLAASIEMGNATINVADLPTIRGFESDLGLLFQNLIGNAIKFRRPDIDPVVTISSSENSEYWKFEVCDNGIGIEVENREEIFKIFTRLHLKKEFEGTGIGLAHCKKIVELHNGEISMVPATTFGSIFKFTILKKLTSDE